MDHLNGQNNGNNPQGNKPQGNGDRGSGKNNKNGQLLMSFIMIAMVVLFGISLFSNKFASMNTKETTYDEFLSELDAQNVATV